MTATAIWIFVIIVSVLFAWLICWCKALTEKSVRQDIKIKALRDEIINNYKHIIRMERQNEKQQMEPRQKDS